MELSQNVAVMATVAYILADMDERLGGPPSQVRPAQGAAATQRRRWMELDARMRPEWSRVEIELSPNTVRVWRVLGRAR